MRHCRQLFYGIALATSFFLGSIANAETCYNPDTGDYYYCGDTDQYVYPDEDSYGSTVVVVPYPDDYFYYGAGYGSGYYNHGYNNNNYHGGNNNWHGGNNGGWHGGGNHGAVSHGAGSHGGGGHGGGGNVGAHHHQ